MCACNDIVIPVNLSHNITAVNGVAITPVTVSQFVSDRLGDFWIRKNSFGQNVLMSTLLEGDDLYLTSGGVDVYAKIVIGGHPPHYRPGVA